MSKIIEFLPDGLGRVGKRSYSFTRLEMPRGELNFNQTKNIFYLQDFYDLLNEEGEITIWQKDPIGPQTSTYQKVYTMGPGIDFPLIMNYTDTGNGGPYFYFLNGHGDVTYFADQNFTEEQIETYEYNPWGVLLTSASKNNLLYTSREFDFETGLQFNRLRYYLNSTGRFTSKDLIISTNYFVSFNNNPLKYKDYFGLTCVDDTRRKYYSCLDPCNTAQIWKCYGLCEECCRKQARVGRITFAIGGAALGGILGAIVAGVGGVIIEAVYSDCISECKNAFDPSRGGECIPPAQAPSGVECPKNAPNCDPIK